MAANMKWKLYTRDDNVRPPAVGSEEYDSRERALQAACGKRKAAHLAVLYIEEPDGEQILPAAIRQWCERHE